MLFLPHRKQLEKMNMEFTANLNAEIKVTFDNPEKAKAEFIDGDWDQTFWDIPDMESLVRDLSFALYSSPEEFIYNEETGKSHWEKSPEGFGVYIKADDAWVMDNEHTGKIIVSIDDPEVECVHEAN